jgi:alpha,alpha-trehalase
MTVYVLRTALKAIDSVAPSRKNDLLESLGVAQEELARWEDIVRKMRVVFHDNQIISQFEGYDQLQEFDWDGYEEKYGDIQRLDRILEAEGDTPNRYKVSKQADVLMLLYLFSAEELQELFSHMGYDFDPETIPRNIEYYLKRSSHGSTLSNIVHSWVLSRLDRPRSLTLFNKALESDIVDIQGGTTHEGIHLGAMAGTVDILQRCYTGLEFHNDTLFLNPNIPDDLPQLSMRVKYQGNWFGITITSDVLTITCDQCNGEATKVSFQGTVHALKPGDSLEFELGKESETEERETTVPMHNADSPAG